MQAQKYLSHHAEAETQNLALDAHFDFALVLPCYDEKRGDIERFILFCARKNALLILVVNQPDNVADCTRNADIIDWIESGLHLRVNTHTAFCRLSNAGILLVDRTQKRIPAEQGVGLARKIGADCAYALIASGNIHTPWIFSTDADATLPDDYFDAAFNAINAAPKASAIVLPFVHTPCGEIDLDIATALYELRLHTYVDGLRSAGSPYAFHTVGSTLIVNATHYAQAHGFPKRAGGEDFYLLNKLVKLAPVISAQQPLLQLQARASHRVPFGTGPATAKLRDAADMCSVPIFYNPRSFEMLAQWLAFLAHCAQVFSTTDCDIGGWKTQLAAHAGSTVADALLHAVDAAQTESTLHKARQHCSNATAFLRYLHTWFDGFATLKLLHALRDHAYPLLTVRQRFADMPIENTLLLEHVTQLNAQARTHIGHVSQLAGR